MYKEQQQIKISLASGFTYFSSTLTHKRGTWLQQQPLKAMCWSVRVQGNTK